MKLRVAEFLNRLLLHVPLPGFHMVRGCGLYSRTGREDLQRCREHLAQSEPATDVPRSGAASLPGVSV